MTEEEKSKGMNGENSLNTSKKGESTMSTDEKEQKRITRREFVKGAAVGAAGVAAAGALASCTTAATPQVIRETVEVPVEVIKEVEVKSWLPEKWDKEADVVVVGTGDAGGPAAIRAFDGGASVIMIDKGDFFGGCSTLGGGNSQLCNTHVQQRFGIEDHAEWGFEDVMEMGLHRSNPDVLDAWTENSDAFTYWMEETCDFEYGRVAQQSGARVPRSHLPAAYGVHSEGRGIIHEMHFFAQLEKRNIPVLLEHRMTRIYREPNGPVLGIEVATPSGIINIKAKKAVILATGGFKGNRQMLRAWHPAFDEDLVYTGWPDVNPTGDGHLAIMEIGGGCVDMSFICEFSGKVGSRQYVRWDRPHFTTPSTSTGLPEGERERLIFVENSGNRYLDEIAWVRGHTLPWTPWMLAFLAIKGRPRMEWFVTDQDGADASDWTPLANHFQNPDPTVSPCCEPGWVAIADTIAELAVKMGVPATNLEATIARYNGFAQGAGVDEDFNRPGPLYPIIKPPFWAARFCRMAHDQCTGIRVNQRMQVVDQAEQWQPVTAGSKPIGEEKVIPHLYAAGECTGGTGGAIRGSGKRGWYQVHGYIAGDLAAKETPVT